MFIYYSFKDSRKLFSNDKYNKIKTEKKYN